MLDVGNEKLTERDRECLKRSGAWGSFAEYCRS